MIFWIERIFCWLLGMSFFAPALAAFNVGNTTGIQFALILGALCGVVRVFRRGFVVDPLTSWLLALWSVDLLLSNLVSGFSSKSTHAMVAFLANIGFVGFFGLAKPHRNDEAIIQGIVAGALIDSAYALYQALAADFNLPFGIPHLNNSSYALYSDVAALATSRSYAFCPEPSVLAALLIPSCCLLLARVVASSARRGFNVACMLLVICGIIMTGSLSLAVSLPLSLGATALILYRNRRAIFVPVLSTFLVLMGAGVIILSWSTANELFVGVADRLASGFDDPSVAVRYGTKQAAIGLFLDHPIVGDGVMPPEADFLAYLPQSAIQHEVATGVDSLPLQILSGHGIIGFACFVALVGIGLYRSNHSPARSVFLLTSLLTMSLQVGYDSLYHLWIMLGLCIAKSASAKGTRSALGDTAVSDSVPNGAVLGDSIARA
jgi:hypothetical protein